MKLSTLMVIISVGLFLGVLAVYNFSLKAAYVKGTFRERFGEHTFRKLAGVKEIQLFTTMGVSIEEGEQEGVWISDRVKDLVAVKRSGDRVLVSLVDQDSVNYMLVHSSDVVFVVKKLEKLSALSDGKAKVAHDLGGEIMISGLKGDLFQIEVSENYRVNLAESRFKLFKSIVGGSHLGSSLVVSHTNHIDTAYFNVRGTSSLELFNPDISVPYYDLGDSSRVLFSGKMASQLNTRK